MKDAELLREVANRYQTHVQDGRVSWGSRAFWDDVKLLPETHPARQISSILHAGDDDDLSRVWWLRAAINMLHTEADLLDAAEKLQRPSA